MARIFQASARIQHHTITTTGLTFSVPSTEDFTAVDGSGNRIWTKTDLLKSEFGINETDNTLSIRTGNNVKQIDVWSQPIVKSLSLSGSGNYLIGDVSIPQKDASNNYQLSQVEFRFSVNSIGDTNVKDFLSGSGGILSWKPSGGSYSFISTSTYTYTKQSTGEFTTYFGVTISGTESSTSATASFYITQSGGTIRSATSKFQYKINLL